MNPLSNRQRIGYGVGDIAICFYWSGVGLYLLYFYTDIVGISPYLAGWIYALGIAWDAVTDPFMGYLAERTSSKRGKYRPYIFFGTIPLALSFVLLFWVPPLTGLSLFMCLLLINVFHRTCFTIVSVPYSSLTPRITSDSEERTKLTTARMIGASFGTLLMSSLGFPIINFFGQNDESLGIVYLSCFAAFFAVIILYITYGSVKESSTEEIRETYPSISKLIFSILKNYPFWIVFSSILILGSTTIMFNKNLIYYIKYALDLHSYQGLVLGLSGLSSFASIPFWSYVSLKIGKRNTWQISMSLLLLAFALFYFYQISSLQELIIIVCLIGAASGAGGVLFWSMLPDTIEYGEWKSGIRSESSLYGFMTFAQKSSIAVAALVLGVLLTSINFSPNEVQTPETLSGLKNIMSLIPASGIAISIFLMYFYPINSAYHKELLINIEARKNG